MFSRILNRDAVIYMKNGMTISGYIFQVENGFIATMEINKGTEFQYTLINLDEISLIKARHLISNEMSTACRQQCASENCCSQTENSGNKCQNPVRVVAKVSRSNEFSMPLPSQEQEGPYKLPTFERQTERGQ